MHDTLTFLRTKYFQNVAKLVPPNQIQFVVLTHILNDRPELLTAIELIAPISLLIGIPYSNNLNIISELNKRYKILTPSMDELYNEKYLKKIILENVVPNKAVVILEIGGYFSGVLRELSNELHGNLLGIIEDTEHGHRKYEKLDELFCPIVSVARSSLKKAEDFLVGASCLYSTEKLFRHMGFPIESKASLVLGFGKIGRGLAHSLARRNCNVMVYDSNPIKRIEAMSEGFQAIARQAALQNASVIYGTTGNCSIDRDDFKHIKNGTALVSCSSKDIEFDLSSLNELYKKTSISNDIDRYENHGHILYLFAKGQPINFLDDAVIGPVLALLQSAIILAIKKLLDLQEQKGIFELDEKMEKHLADLWLETFCDDISGYYKNG